MFFLIRLRFFEVIPKTVGQYIKIDHDCFLPDLLACISPSPKHPIIRPNHSTPKSNSINIHQVHKYALRVYFETYCASSIKPMLGTRVHTHYTVLCTHRSLEAVYFCLFSITITHDNRLSDREGIAFYRNKTDHR